MNSYEIFMLGFTASAFSIGFYLWNKLPNHNVKRVVVVNDCGYVWEDLKPYLPDTVEWQFIKRTRGLWSKTFGIFLKILFSRGDFYIANFALQDAWLIQKLTHLDLLICHGGDLRKTLKSRRWGWMVKSNLRAARKVAYTSEDTMKTALHYRSDAFLLRRPIRTEIYKPLHARDSLDLSVVYFQKNYDALPPEISEYLIKNECSLTVIDEVKIPHNQMPLFFSNYDVFIDQTVNPDLSKMCLEAMSCGLPVITWKDRHRMIKRLHELMSPERREMEAQRNREYVVENYDACKVALEIPQIIHQ